MGMGSIHIRGKKRRISVLFMYLSIRRHEKTNYFCETGKNDCKCRSCRSAVALLGEIERKIADGIFDYKEYFPDSKTLNKLDILNLQPDITFGTYVSQWYDSQEKVFTHSTRLSYTSMIKQFIDHFGSMPLRNIKPAHMRAYVNSLDIAPKTIRNRVGLLSEIFKCAISDDLLDKNPCTNLKLPPRAPKEIDPFTHKEVDLILKWLDKNKPKMVGFFAVAFYTGMRTGEIMGLKWGDIDFNRFTITVQRTITNGQEKQSTKTNSVREIEIPEELDSYLNSQKSMTFLHSEYVFVNYRNEPFTSYSAINDYYWAPCLKALGLRYRTKYQTRHTFACLMIEKGEDLNWIKNTLGHSSLKMLVEHYGNRIERREHKGRRKFGTLFGTN